jgi:hypothetical protein
VQLAIKIGPQIGGALTADLMRYYARTLALIDRPPLCVGQYRRADDGKAAADTYLDMIAHFRSQPTEGNAEAFRGPLRAFPMAAALSKRYGATDRYKEEAIGFLNDPRPHFSAAKAHVLIDSVADKKLFGRSELELIRDIALTLPEALAGNDHELISGTRSCASLSAFATA